MRVLQKRLEDTEAQMTRILQAMQNMQSRMATMAQPSFSHASKETKQSSEVASVGNIDGSQIKEEITREDQSKEETLVYILCSFACRFMKNKNNVFFCFSIIYQMWPRNV